MNDLTPQAFNELAAQIARLNNLPLDRAADLLVEVGDCIYQDAHGKVIVVDPQTGEPISLIWPNEE